MSSADHKVMVGGQNIVLLMPSILSFREAPLRTTHPGDLPSKRQATQEGRLIEIKMHPTMR